MMSRRRASIAVLAAIGLCASISTEAWGHRHESAAELRAKIARERSPVKKAKLEIRLGHVELERAADAFDQNHPRQGQALLARYLKEMDSSWTVLEGSGRNAARKPDGFMNLEIALRENARFLTDLRGNLIYAYQQPIKAILGTINTLHSKVLLALFPGARSPSQPGAKGVKAGVSSFASKTNPL